MRPPPAEERHRELALADTADPRACHTGIAWVRETLTEWQLLDHSQDALLIAAELLSNAVRHGGGIHTLGLTRHDERLRISVTDPSPVPPRLREHRPDSIGGHGIFLVDRLAHDWGCRPHHRGKTVWADLALLPATARSGDGEHP
ncbi:ATP-binding protein [Streptomyces bambusae]|uniref:ATP-binding protein n=1 Tax=Streptomyces bambusae TaxID=1550616 RepID=UPI001CFCAFB0|nr:ATP-binding protein [Streptomyces bambusae]MCB5164550.1 ATP-binding protein [Streptomyces bambusae]